MRKILVGLVSIFLLIYVTGCNLPTNNQETPDLVASQVSMLLTHTPTIDGGNQATPGQIPTITLASTLERPQSTDTATPTIEPSITATELVEGIPTGIPNWTDTFENGTRFGINPGGYDDGQTVIIVSNNSMSMTSVTASGWRGWRLTSQKPGNYYLQANFQTQECNGSDQYGLVIQAPDYDSGQGFYFGLTCDGRYAFQKWEDGGLTNIQGWNNDTNIKSGSDQSNILGVLKSGTKYTLYVNNIELVTIEDDKFSNPGYFGPFIAGVNTSNFTIQLDEISYWLIQ